MNCSLRGSIVVRDIRHKAEEWHICTQIQKQANKTTESPTPSSNASSAQGPLDLGKISADIQQLKTTKADTPLPSQISRLTTQLQELDHAQRTACTLGVYFFAHRSATYAVATAAGIATLAALAFVSKKGWDQSNNAIINIGMTSGLVLFSALTFSQLYGQGSNYESQRIKYALAIDLINKVASANLSNKRHPPQPMNTNSPVRWMARRLAVALILATAATIPAVPAIAAQQASSESALRASSSPVKFGLNGEQQLIAKSKKKPVRKKKVEKAKTINSSSPSSSSSTSKSPIKIGVNIPKTSYPSSSTSRSPIRLGDDNPKTSSPSSSSSSSSSSSQSSDDSRSRK